MTRTHLNQHERDIEAANELGPREFSRDMNTLLDSIEALRAQVAGMKRELASAKTLIESGNDPWGGGDLQLVEDTIDPRTQGPNIICLCGSTRFTDTWINEYQRLSDAGNIVLTVARMPPRPTLQRDQPELKVRLDELHKRKIDLADEVFVLNVGNYIGDSTRSEIAYAEANGKPVKYLESRLVSEWADTPAKESE